MCGCGQGVVPRLVWYYRYRRATYRKELYCVSMAQFVPYSPPGAAAVPSSRVELRISCKKLRDTDVFSKSDPLVAVYTARRGGIGWGEVSSLLY